MLKFLNIYDYGTELNERNLGVPRHNQNLSWQYGKEWRFIRHQICQSHSVGLPPESPNLTLMVSISMAIVMLEKRQKTTYPEARCF